MQVTARTKTYYNINIVSNTKDGEFESDAKFSVALNQALIEDVSQYQFMLEKFKIDSESIPIFHVDLMQPQAAVVTPNEYVTNYMIYIIYNGAQYSTNVTWIKPNHKPARVAKQTAAGIYYDNRDPMFAVYSYDAFLNSVNDALTRLFTLAGLTGPAFFVYDHIAQRIQFFTPQALNIVVYFSKNLFPFVGEGFNCIFYYQRPALIASDVFSHFIEIDPRRIDVQTILGVAYVKINQEYTVISSWTSVNRILFVSNRLPIKREFYPIANNNGINDERTYS